MYVDQLKKIWDQSKSLAARSNVNVDKAWEKFESRTSTSLAPVVPLKRNRFNWRAIAASVFIIAGIGLAAFLIFRDKTPQQLLVQTTQDTKVDTLPDGSTITLNKHSTISYPARFNKETRPVTLTGEAFFEVEPDQKKPFIVSVDDLQVTVVGTSFNIKKEKDHIDVIVETGIVRVTHGDQSVELTAGEKARFSSTGTPVVKEKVTDKLYNYYHSREFVCDDTPLWKLVDVLNEAYGADIVLGREELRDVRLNTTFYNESLDKVLEIIHLTFDLEVTREPGGRIVLE